VRRHAEVEADTEKLLLSCWPLVQRLAQAAVRRKAVSSAAHGILFRAMRKDLRRADKLNHVPHHSYFNATTG
jgi:hypothetical protein